MYVSNETRKKILIVMFITFIISGLIYLLGFYEEKTFQSIELPTENVIMNFSKINYADTIVSVGLSELKISGKYIVIKNLDEDVKLNFNNNNNLTLHAMIIGLSPQYVIYVDKNLSRSQSIVTLSHELIHLQQYELGHLSIINNSFVKWKGDVININSYPYSERPWEKMAFENENGLAIQIKKILY